MTPLEIIGLIATLLMGVVLGLAGAGGSILTVPILVYLFGVSATQATGVSLAIVGGVAFLAAIIAHRKGDLDPKAAVLFGIPSVLIAFSIRRWLIPAVPESIGGLHKESLLLVLFALAMFMAARAMLRGTTGDQSSVRRPSQWILGGLGAGTVTGVLGAGGGFVIVPALHAGMGLPIRKAIGTSLAVISLNAGAGLLAEIATQSDIPWEIAGRLGLFAVGGMALGMALQSRISNKKLKVGFGILIIGVAIFILGNEIFAFR